LRVLQVLEPPDGGIPHHVRALTGGLLERGHAVDAVVSNRGGLAGDLQDLGAGVVALDLRPQILAAGADVRALRALAAILRSGRWDVVHTHGNKAGVLGRVTARLAGLPVVHSPHGFAYLTQEWRVRGGRGARRALTLGIERPLAPWTQAVVFVSEADREQALRDRVVDRRRTYVIHNGVDAPTPAEPDPRLVAFGHGLPLVGFLARLHEQKAPLLLVEALAMLRDRDASFRAALVGSGPLAQATRERVDELGLQETVAVLPFTGEVGPALAAFDLYVLPSLWESLPVGVLEAMAMGLPVLASDVGGVREAVDHDRTGLLVPRGAVTELVDAMERLLGDEHRRQAMGEAGRRRWRERFRVAAMVEATERVYERVLAGLTGAGTG
jgi:glycosyltransferase involved in cell wall biosynthesis